MNSDDQDCISPEELQDKAREEEKTQRNIFNILAGGYNVIKKLKKRAICIVGKTKSGKSTSMHWMAGKTLLGKKKQEGDIVVYQVQTQGIAISEKFFSETLIPNALTLKLKNEQISIVDMAGFQDLTNYRGVIGVSYMLQEVLAQIDEVKFILTIDASVLQGITVDYILEPFQNFIKMFEYDDISSNFPELRDKILDSLVLLVSRANSSIDYYGNLSNAIKQLKQQKLKKKNKDKVRKILHHIHKNKKMFLFPKAVAGQYPDECNFLDDAIGNESWKYLNLKDPAIQKCEKFVQLPFAQSFEKMQPIQQNLFMENIKLRIDSWSKLPPIINAFVKRSAANFLNKSGTYASEFQGVIKFNKEEDRYKDVMTEYDMIQQINQDITIREEDQKYRKPAVYGLQCVKKLINFLELIQKIDRVDSVTDMKILHQRLSKALKIGQQIFCQTYKEEQQWIMFSFIILHSFHEFQSLRKIDPYRVNAASIFDTVNLFSEISSRDITLIFIRSKQTKQYFEELFENQEKCNEYISFFYTFLKQINEDNFADEAQKQSLKQQMEMEIIRLHKEQARFYLNRLKLAESLSATINAQNILNQYSKAYEYENSDDQDQSESQSQQNVNPEIDTDDHEDKPISKSLTQKDILNNIENNRIELYELFGQILLKKNTKESVLIAKDIFEHIIYIDSACKTYEKLFDLQTEKSQKYKILLAYANYCKISYKFNDSKAILLRAVQYSSNSVERKKTRKLISEFLMDRQTLEGDQPNKLSSIKRIKNKPELISQIQTLMNNKDNELYYVSIFSLPKRILDQDIDQQTD